MRWGFRLGSGSTPVMADKENKNKQSVKRKINYRIIERLSWRPEDEAILDPIQLLRRCDEPPLYVQFGCCLASAAIFFRMGCRARQLQFDIDGPRLRHAGAKGREEQQPYVVSGRRSALSHP
jgi:hypothetical protein